MKSAVRTMVALLLVALCSLFDFSQAETGNVSGTVTDPGGAVVSGAKVTVVNTGTGLTRNQTTSNTGTYTVTNLPPGDYQITVEGTGFSPYKRKMQVTVGGRST